jgi:hypothetical protein
MIKRISPNIKECWWCGDTQLTGEHKIKDTSVKYLLGKSENPVLVKNGRNYPLQNSSSKFLKFPRCICANCNGNLSQDFDNAYDTFFKYILNHEIEIQQEKYINLQSVFGSTWELDFLMLLRYFSKQAGCQARTGAFDVSNGIIDFLEGENHLAKDLIFNFELRPANLALKLHNNGEITILYLGPFSWYQPNQVLFDTEVQSLTGWYTISHVSINYHYELNVSEKNHLANQLIGPKLYLTERPLSDIETELGKDNIYEIIPNLESKGRKSVDDLVEIIDKLKADNKRYR